MDEVERFVDVESYIEGIMEEDESHETNQALILQNEVDESEFQTPPRRTTTDDVADLLETPEPPAVPVIELDGHVNKSPSRKRLRSKQSCPLFPLPLPVYKDIENVKANAEELGNGVCLPRVRYFAVYHLLRTLVISSHHQIIQGNIAAKRRAASLL